MSDKTKTEIIAKAMRNLSDVIVTNDGVANAAILQAAERLEAQEKEIAEDKTYISGLESIVKEQKKEIERINMHSKELIRIISALKKKPSWQEIDKWS